jgi:hypothetical protein
VPETRVEIGVPAAASPRIASPIEQTDRRAAAESPDPPLRRPAQLRTMACGRPKVLRTNTLRTDGARLKIPEDASRRRTTRSSKKRDGRDGSTGAGVDPAGGFRRLSNGSRSRPAGTMVQALARRGNDERLRSGGRGSHASPAAARERIQSLWNNSSQARRVRETPSGKPVRMWSTLPSVHSRNTWGIR